jgi:hypothetical protein
MVKMKNKLVLIAVLMIFLVAGLAINHDAGLAQDQQIRSQIINNAATQVTADTANTTDAGNIENSVVAIKNPTFKEVKDFILKDPTNRNQFIPNKYECRHFATDVNNNADKVGIRCAFVLLCYSDGQHAVVGFDTTDRGMVYIEPQTDAAIEPVVGGYYQGQEIIEILVGW